MCAFNSINKNKRLLLLHWLLAVGILMLAGMVYRNQASALKLIVDKPITLPTPLKTLPLKINNWVGQDIPISEHIQQITKNDDFLNRLYVNRSTSQWVELYVAYSGRPRTMKGHKPVVCYTAGGWVHNSTEQSQFLSYIGRPIPCLIHRFHKPTSNHDEIVVLNFYILNGQVTHDENSFSGLGWRTPNIAGDPARYVAQIQISSPLENTVRTAAKDIVDTLFEFLPDQYGKVKAAEYYDNTIDVQDEPK